MLDEELIGLSKEAFAFLTALAESGNVEMYGLPSSPGRIEKLLCHVLGESVNILREEDETLSIETLGGLTAVRRLVTLQHAVAKLPDGVRPELKQAFSQKKGGT